MRFRIIHRAVATFFTAGVLFLSLPPTAGAQTTDPEGGSGVQAAISVISELPCSFLLPEATSARTSTEPGHLVHPRALDRCLVPPPTVPELQQDTREQRLQAILADIPRWSPEKATADLTPISPLDFGLLLSSPRTPGLQPSTEKKYRLRLKPYQGPPLDNPGVPYAYSRTETHSVEIFRLAW